MSGTQTPYNINNISYAQLEQTIQELRVRLAQVENNSKHESFPNVPIDKNNTPEPFDGLDKSRFKNFMSHAKLIIQLQANRFPNDRSKSLYIATLLRGPAFSWIQPYLDDDSPECILNNFPCFENQLLMLFGDKHQGRSAATALSHLKQNTSVSAYAAEFHHLSKMTDWNDAALIDKFLDGLSHQTRRGLIGQAIPNTLVDLIDQATQVDALTQAYHHNPGKYHHNTYYRNSNSMDVDSTATRRLPLTDFERKCRLRERLCLYCGEANHMKIHCPHIPKRPRLDHDHNTDSGKEPAQRQ